MDKIIELIQESKFSIHDLSRLQSQKSREFYRLNMPFELGLDFGARKFAEDFETKKFLILESSPYDYMKAISDLNAFDIKNHNDDPEDVVTCLTAWCSETVGLRNLGGHFSIWQEYNNFTNVLFDVKVQKYLREYPERESKKFAKNEI